MKIILDQLNIGYCDEAVSDWVYPNSFKENLVLQNRIIRPSVIPNVEGMGIRDALFILEEHGLEVQFKGKGKVIKQSLKAGEEITDLKTIQLELS